MISNIETFFAEDTRWQESYRLLREIISESGLLQEEYKWYKPCYTHGDENVVLMHGFNDYCALLFMKGVLMDDPHELLVAQTANVQSARQLRFTSVDQIQEMRSVILTYLKEAVRVQESGMQVEMKSTEDYSVPDELLEKFEEMPELREAFEALTPGRQRGYLLYFSDAKLATTRYDRIHKSIDKIMEGIGLHDR